MSRHALLLLFAVFALGACKDECKVTDCGENGNCVGDGECECEEGWTGNYCNEPDPCLEIDCGEFGTCVEGECVCEEGYEGDFCDEVMRDKFLGTYNASDDCPDISDSTYTVVFLEGTDTTDIYSLEIDGIWQYFTVTASINEEGDEITIPEQEVGNNDEWTVSGQCELTTSTPATWGCVYNLERDGVSQTINCGGELVMD